MRSAPIRIAAATPALALITATAPVTAAAAPVASADAAVPSSAPAHARTVLLINGIVASVPAW